MEMANALDDIFMLFPPRGKFNRASHRTVSFRSTFKAADTLVVAHDLFFAYF